MTYSQDITRLAAITANERGETKRFLSDRRFRNKSIRREHDRFVADQLSRRGARLPRPFVIEPTQVERRERNNGETYDVDYLFVLEKGMLLRDALAPLNDRYPATYCKHSHDCCGHFYGGGWYRTSTKALGSGVYIITQTFNCNI